MAGLGGRCIAIHSDGLAIVLQQRRLARGKIESQHKNCIVTAEAVGCWTVSQHRAVTRPARPRHGVGRAGAGARRSWGTQELGSAGSEARAAGGRAAHAPGRQAAIAHGWKDLGARAQQAGARGRAGLGARAGQGYALGALGLFLARFDSVLFLSQIFGRCS